ncbi:hypothetical protein AB0I27_06760 [Streptomyces sp. NPDC050597]|uniref:hypothetical protein n=1 Tax=Streptomyces sp. NPDC050597 TaxID=3157212 RepID=UPI00341DBE03
MSDKKRKKRVIKFPVPRIRVRWSSLSNSGIAAAIATGHVEGSAMWALVVLGATANVCEVIAAALTARSSK